MRLWAVGTATNVSKPVMGRLTTEPVVIGSRSDAIPYVTPETRTRFANDWRDYPAVLSQCNADEPLPVPTIVQPSHLDYLGSGDVVHLYPDGTVQVLYRRSFDHNTTPTTE